MAEFNHREIDKKWQSYWDEHQIFKTTEDPAKTKFYTLDMFPYPSGNGLHVGHPMGYLGTDIVARRKRMEGFNVLHPMGYDAFGLPAEQHAIQTGKHPAATRTSLIVCERFMRFIPPDSDTVLPGTFDIL